MKTRKILLVEDNDEMRKLVRLTLTAEGYEVVESPDAETALRLVEVEHPDLVLQDYVLPDMAGGDLLRSVRSLTADAPVPILALTGRALEGDGGFDRVLTKPIQRAALIDAVASYLPADGPEPVAPGRGRRLLLVDDDPVQLKLWRIALGQAGFHVTTASDGTQGLAEARREKPDAVVSDVLMPGVDGFRLCLAVRADADLAHVPLVLVSSNYVDEDDRKTAERMGANALVTRTGSFEEAVRNAIEAIMRGGVPTPPPAEGVPSEYYDAVVRQVTRQAVRQEALVRKSSVQTKVLAAIASLSDALSRDLDVETSLGDALYRVLDVVGMPKGAVFLVETDGSFRLGGSQGFERERLSELGDFFGREEILVKTLGAKGPVRLDAPTVGREAAQILRARAGVESALLVALASKRRPIGVLFLGAQDAALEEAEWISYARMLGSQLGQAIAIGRTLGELAIARDRYRALMENANDGVFVLSTEGVILEVNARGMEIEGRPRSEIVGRSFVELLSPTDAPIQMALFRKGLERGHVHSHDIVLSRPDGSRRIVDVSGRVVELDRERVVIAIAHDMTERKSLEEQLHQAQKMEAIGRLTGGVAHDFNNLLAVILAHSSFLIEDLPSADPRRADAEEIRSASERAAALTRQLLAFGRKDVQQTTVFQPNEVVEGIRKLLGRLIGEDIYLVTALGPDVGTVRADVSQLEQVLVNLVVNARDAMPRGGRVTLETKNVELDAEYAIGHHEVVPGPYVMIAVSDEGSGMDEETRRRAFEPFFTTKAEGRGTGLGLSTCYGIVRQSGGYIWIYSEIGHGTTVKVFLPRTSDPVVEHTARPVGTLEGTETILLLEDEPGVRAVLQRALEAKGYHLLVAKRGDEAIAYARTYDGPIHLLLTDVVMPGANGPEVAKQFRVVRPSARVLYISGYTDHAVLRDGLLERGVAFLQKPFAPEAVARKVREVLDDPTAGADGGNPAGQVR